MLQQTRRSAEKSAAMQTDLKPETDVTSVIEITMLAKDFSVTTHAVPEGQTRSLPTTVVNPERQRPIVIRIYERDSWWKKLCISCTSNNVQTLVDCNFILLRPRILLVSLMYFMQFAMTYALQHTHTHLQSLKSFCGVSILVALLTLNLSTIKPVG